jgi:hypothetical protein
MDDYRGVQNLMAREGNDRDGMASNRSLAECVQKLMASEGNSRDEMVKAKTVADYLKTTEGNLARLRWEGRGPAFYRLGRSIRYSWSDVDLWAEENRQQTGGRA